jgi:hypothetical protein
MGCDVFANNDEIACKAGDGKVIAAFPDVCLSPPSPPAGPVPIPYPNTSMSKDMQSGSKTVMIKSQEVMLKDQSFYKTSPLGDEAATNSFGASVVTHVITGKTYFIAYSMDVQFEGQNVDRHSDMTTSNHASQPGSTPPMANLAAMAAPPGTQGKLFCDCCNGPVHSKAQAFGQEISEDEFYKPTSRGPASTAAKKGNSSLSKRELGEVETSSFVVDFVRQTGTCKELLPPKPPGDDPCNKYYRNQPPENKAARKAFADFKDGNPAYAGSNVGHKVPLAAGGCPTGAGNLQAVPPGCQDVESMLGTSQGQMASIVR